MLAFQTASQWSVSQIQGFLRESWWEGFASGWLVGAGVVIVVFCIFQAGKSLGQQTAPNATSGDE